MAEDTRSGEVPPTVSGADIRTFLFADMRGYTRFTQEHGDDAASALAGRFADLVRGVVPEFEGELLELRGDEALCVFRSARQALRASVELQRQLRTATDNEPAFALGVGMGLDAGEAIPTQGGYRGASLNLAARLCGIAKPGEVLATESAAHLARLVDGLRLVARRPVRLKGVDEPVRLVQVVPEAPLAPVPSPPSTGPRRRPRTWIIATSVVLAALVGGVAVYATRGGGTRVFAVQPDSVGVLTAGKGLGLARPLGGTPAAMAAGANHVWISQPASGDVLEVDPTTGNTVPIHLGTSGFDAPQGVAFGDGGLWVADSGTGTVSEINPQVGRPVTSPLYVGNGPSGVAVTPGAVWVTLSLDGALVRIDPASPRVVRTIAVGADPTQVAFGAGHLWVTNEAAATVTPVDSTTGTAGAPIQVGPGPNGIVYGAGAVWVTSSLGGTVWRINPRTDVVSGVFHAGNRPEGITVIGHTVWIAARGSQELVGLNTRNGSIVSQIHLAGEPQDVATVHGRIAFTTAATPTLHRGGTLTVVTQGLGDDIDPASVGSGYYDQWEGFGFSYDGLVAFKRVAGPDGENVVPDLATAIPAPADHGLTYRFHVRSELRYSNGRLIRAADIRYGFERMYRIANPAYHPQLSFFSAIRGAGQCTHHLKTCHLGAGIDVHGSTVTFHLSRPDPDFVPKLAMPYAVAVPTGTPMRDLGLRPLPATGPYKVASYANGVAVWVRNPYFHQWSADAQPAGYPARIVMRAMSAEQQVSAVETGSADLMLDRIPIDRITEVTVRHPAQLHPQPLPETDFINLDIHAAPFTDARARQALAYAINRAKIVQLLGAFNSHPTCQMIPPNFPGYRPYCQYTLHPTSAGTWSAPDMQRAHQLVRAARTKGTMVRVCVGRPADPVMAYVSHVVRRIGYNAVTDPACKKDAVSGLGWIQDYPGANDFLDLFGCPGPVGCYLPWVNDRIQRAYLQAAQDSVAGLQAWAELDRAITDKAPMIPIDTPVSTGFTSRRVGNYQYAPAPGSGPLIDQMWVR